MRYQHSFDIQAPLEDVSRFHSRSSSLGAITPPPLRLRVEDAPEVLRENKVMAFTLRIGPFSLIWKTRIENQSIYGFIDRQLEGPFEHWSHKHTFVPLGDALTRVSDEIEFELRRHPIWGLVGAVMALGLPLMFRYRAWKTRRLLQSMELLDQEAYVPNR
jgi:ligand-binding SRPBCC domain-containing protein